MAGELPTFVILVLNMRVRRVYFQKNDHYSNAQPPIILNYIEMPETLPINTIQVSS